MRDAYRAMACAHCGYRLISFAEAVEASEAGGRCPLCGGGLDLLALERMLEAWSDAEVREEGRQRAEEDPSSGRGPRRPDRPA